MEMMSQTSSDAARRPERMNKSRGGAGWKAAGGRWHQDSSRLRSEPVFVLAWQEWLPRAWLPSHRGSLGSCGWCSSRGRDGMARSWAWHGAGHGTELGRHLRALRAAVCLPSRSPGASGSAWGREMIYSPSVCKELNHKGRMELGAFLEYSNHSLLHHTWLLCIVSHNSFQLSDSSTRSESRDDYPEKKSNYRCSTSNILLMFPLML